MFDFYLFLLVFDGDECASNPCTVDSTCIDGYFNYTCSCANGTFGERCKSMSIILVLNIVITARKRSLGQGNIFASVCHSVHRGGVPGQVPSLDRYITLAGTSPGQVSPAGTPPGSRYSPLVGTPWQVHPQTGTPTPLGRYTLLAGTPPGRYTPRAGTPLQAGTPPGRYYEIWSMSGR